MGSVDFSWCSVSFGVGSFLGRFLFLHMRVAFALLLQLVILRISSYLRVGSSRSPEFMVLPGISPFFFCFLGFVPFLRLWLDWFCSFCCKWLFSSFCVLFGWCTYFLSSRTFLGFFVFLLPPGPPLGSCVLLSGSGRCVLLWVSLASSCRAAVLQAVPSAVFLLCLLLFSPVAWSLSVVRYCFLPLSLRPLPAVIAVVFPSEWFRFLPYFLARSMSGTLSLLLLRCVRSYRDGLRLPSGCFPSVIYSCSSSFLARVTFLPSRMGALFVSP